MSIQETREAGQCPECDGGTAQSVRNEVICDECGLIVEEDSIDRGPDWRAFNYQEFQKKARVGPPTTETLHDRGLATTISWNDTDFHGNPLSARKRRQMHRLRTWNQWSQTSDSHQQYRKQAFGEIERMAAALGLPADVRETSCVLFRQSHEAGIVAGRSIESVAAATMHIAATIAGYPRTLDEIAHVARVGRKPIARAKRAINAEFDLAVEPRDPTEYLKRFGSQLNLDEKTHRTAREILQSAPDTYLGSGASPVAIAAGALYLADGITGGQSVSQRAVSEACDVCIATIQTHHPKLREFYEQSGLR